MIDLLLSGGLFVCFVVYHTNTLLVRALFAVQDLLVKQWLNLYTMPRTDSSRSVM